MKKFFCFIICLMLAMGLTGCGEADAETMIVTETSAAVEQTLLQTENSVTPTELPTEQAIEEVVTIQDANGQTIEDFEMKLFINDVEIPVFWEECTAVDELKGEVSNDDIRVHMSMYGGWEQVGSLGRSYTREDRQMTAINGDIVLYSGNQIVVFYGSNSWSYTKLGKMDLSVDKVTELLSKGDITLTITK